MGDPSVTFSFGANWQKYLREMRPDAIRSMVAYVDDWLGDVSTLRFVDVGSGSGLTSLVAHELGARVTSFDIDPHSISATELLWERAGRPLSWETAYGSVLDRSFLSGLGTFDVVVSWGVLHHTGHLWEAIDGAASLVAPGGRLWLALYHRTPQSPRSLRTKRMYNRAPARVKPLIRGAYASAKLAKYALVDRSFRRVRDYHNERGMSWWRDIEDWLGGLPYEVSSPGEVLARLQPLGFELERLRDALGEGGNDVYLFRRAT